MDLTRLEELQSESRTAECDSELYASNCAEMKQLLDDMLKARLALKAGGGGESASAKVHQQELNELRVKFGLAFMNLKKLNRLDKIRTKRIRESTASVMQRVDTFHLQLQNLRYEVMHLEKEMTKCLQFRSRDQDIQLVSEQEFQASAPESIKAKVSAAETTPSGEHELRLARLEFENAQRKEMHETLQKLDKEKQGFEKKIKTKTSDLASLKPQLAAILEKTKAVQTYLDMPLDEEREQLNLAKFLPTPLFVLFSEMKAYAHACDAKLGVKVVGVLEEAKTFNAAKRNNFANLDDEDDDDGDDDDDEDDDDDDEGQKHGQHKKKKKQRTKEEAEEEEPESAAGSGVVKEEEKEEKAVNASNGKSASNSTTATASSNKSKELVRDEKLRHMFATHPLTVDVKIEIGKANFVELSFCHLSYLEVICVKVNLVFNAEGVSLMSSNTSRDIVGPPTLLSHLLSECDEGNTSPNPATVYTLQRKMGLGLAFPRNKLSQVGAAYKWAQLLAGLNFPDVTTTDSDDVTGNGSSGDKTSSSEDTLEVQLPTIKADRTVCQTHVERIVKAIRERFRARLALQRQLTQLETAKNTQMSELSIIPAELLEAEDEDLHGGNGGGASGVRSKIRAWYSVSYEQYVSLDITRHLVSAGVVSSNDFFYRLQLNRDPATLIALVAISPAYPATPPVFCLNLHWNSEWNMHNSEKVRALEAEINTYYEGDYFSTSRRRQMKSAADEVSRSAHFVLSLQIRRLMILLDVLLESWNHSNVKSSSSSAGAAKVDFPREKMFLEAVRGRRRAPPLKYQRQMQIFTQ